MLMNLLSCGGTGCPKSLTGCENHGAQILAVFLSTGGFHPAREWGFSFLIFSVSLTLIRL